ncbi:hypothetical protein KCP70_12135 [Salmonella enterica subsp. enterica]|nr:hypothetical protein KCP70_12135 [Salmonella enterica subsp. enterica]
MKKPLAEISFGHVFVENAPAQRVDLTWRLAATGVCCPEKHYYYYCMLKGLGGNILSDLWKTAKPFLEVWIKDRGVGYSRKHAGS